VKKILILFVSTILFLYASQEDISKEIVNTINNKLSSYFKSSISNLYQCNNNRPFWVGEENSNRFFLLLGALDNPLYNYKNKNFNRNEIKELSFRIDSGSIPQSMIPVAKARLDVMMSDALMQLLYFMRVGDVDWKLVQKKLNDLKSKQDIHAVWDIHPKPMPSSEKLCKVINSGKLRTFLKEQLPLEDRYRNLVAMLKKYSHMPDFPKLHEGRRLKLGSSDSRISSIKRRLKFFGDYPKNAGINNYFDKNLLKAVRSFRDRFKLPPDDTIDNKMIHYLNMNKYKYVKKILINLDKIKLYPHSFEPTYVEVNVPEYMMRFYSSGKVVFKSDVVVGRIDRPTPIFSSKLRYMVLNPTWTIPDNLVKRDLIPMLKKHPSYLQEHNIHIFDSYKKNAKEVEVDLQKLFTYEHLKDPIPYRFVQYPSSKNALGRVKFMFPNRYSVYLHDTDNKSLFKYRYRVFSSGCMRVKKPFDFMNLLLKYAKGNYTQSKIDEIFESNKPTTIHFKKPIPVHIVYFTVRKEGKKEYFLYDIYLHDEIIWESTEGRKKATFIVPKNRLNPLRKQKKKRTSIFIR